MFQQNVRGKNECVDKEKRRKIVHENVSVKILSKNQSHLLCEKCISERRIWSELKKRDELSEWKSEQK